MADDTTRELHEYVSRVKVHPKVRLEYMKFDEIIAYERIDERKDAIIELLEEYGEIPEALSVKLDKEYSMDKLKKWHKLAVKVESIENL